MLCQNCNQNIATIQVKQTIQGQEKIFNLCPSCARELGYLAALNSLFGSFYPVPNPAINLNYLFGLSEKEEAAFGGNVPRCGFCQSTLEDVLTSGKAGCANCYEAFYPQLKDVIAKLHPASVHTGKIPAGKIQNSESFLKIRSLKEKLETAVREEKYEEAAKWRDEIKALEKKEEE